VHKGDPKQKFVNADNHHYSYHLKKQLGLGLGSFEPVVLQQFFHNNLGCFGPRGTLSENFSRPVLNKNGESLDMILIASET